MSTDKSMPRPSAAPAPDERLAAAVPDTDGHVPVTAGSVATEAALRQRLEQLFRGCDTESESSAARLLFEAVLARRLEAMR